MTFQYASDGATSIRVAERLRSKANCNGEGATYFEDEREWTFGHTKVPQNDVDNFIHDSYGKLGKV